MKTARILIVEDDRPSVEIMLRALGGKGHSAQTAESVEDAAELLAKSSFDLVLLDHVLPGKTGMQSLASLRELTKAPIHLMSGDEIGQDALLLGASGFIPKPIDLRALLDLVAALPERA